MKKYFSAFWGSKHIYFLEGCKKSIIILWLFKSLGNSLSESGHGFSGFFSFSTDVDFWDMWGWLRFFGWFGFSWLWCFWLLSFFWFWSFFFRFLLFSLLFWFLLFSLLFWCSTSWFSAFWINIEQRFSNIQTISSIDVELQQFSCLRTLDLNSNFISLYVSDCFVLLNPFSLLWKIKLCLLFTNSVIVPSLIESAKKGKLMVLPESLKSVTCKEEDVLLH